MPKNLLHGHGKFQREYVADEHEFLKGLASVGQSPDALYIGCSDSRVVPELLTSSSPGALFVLRNIANLVPAFEDPDASVGAALDYAVGHLHVPHIIVCGHYGCGGVKAALDGLDRVRALPSLHEWLGEVHVAEDLPSNPDARWRAAVEANVVYQMENLASYPVVETALASGSLRLHSWVYDIHDGSLSVYDVEKEGFIAASSFF